MGLLETFEQNCQNAAKTAEGRLLSLVHDNEDTEYGQKYGFSSIKSLQDYKSVVSLTDFDDYATDVDRMLHGEKNVLTAYPHRVLRPYDRHRWLVKAHSRQELCDVHEFYAHFIDAGVLAPMKLILLQPQTYALYRDIRIWNGANPNQLKPVHVINNPRKEAFFQALKMYS